MGKGRIVSSQGEGLYTIEILEDRARATTARALAVERIDSIDERLGDLEDEVDAAQVKVNAAIADQDAAIDQYREDIETTGSSDVKLAEFAQKVLEAAAERDTIRAQAGPLRAERLALETRIRRIDALPPLRQIEAWCADYTEDLAGEVSTAEVPGEIGQVVIKPGFEDAAAWSAAEDGAIQPALAGTPASVFYNLAMMPGWQRWRPTFRIATISNVSVDLCDITLEPATSSQQGLGVNAQASYTGVPIFYMECNGGAFEDGDRVLVAFSGNTDQPMVVGFESHPKQCYRYIVVKFPVEELHSSTSFIVGGGLSDSCSCTSYPEADFPHSPGTGHVEYSIINDTADYQTAVQCYAIEALAELIEASHIEDLVAHEIPYDAIGTSLPTMGSVTEAEVPTGEFDHYCESQVIEASLAPRYISGGGGVEDYNFLLSHTLTNPLKGVPGYDVELYATLITSCEYFVSSTYGVYLVEVTADGCNYASVRSIAGGALSPLTKDVVRQISASPAWPSITIDDTEYTPYAMAGMLESSNPLNPFSTFIEGRHNVMMVYRGIPGSAA